jgi:hypothetical protein
MDYAFIIEGNSVSKKDHARYKNLIDKILSGFYPDRIFLNGIYWVQRQEFDNKRSYVSILNKAIGNLTIITWLFREFKFDSFNDLIKFVRNNKKDLFKQGGLYFDNVLAILKISEKKGIKNEKKALKYIKTYLKLKKIEYKIRRTPIYSKADVIDGIDIVITIRDKEYYVQVKPLKSYKIKDGNYLIISSGKIKKYDIHYYIFVSDDGECLFFSNTNLEVKNGYITVPEKDLKCFNI